MNTFRCFLCIGMLFKHTCSVQASMHVAAYCVLAFSLQKMPHLWDLRNALYIVLVSVSVFWSHQKPTCSRIWMISISLSVETPSQKLCSALWVNTCRTDTTYYTTVVFDVRLLSCLWRNKAIDHIDCISLGHHAVCMYFWSLLEMNWLYFSLLNGILFQFQWILYFCF